MPCMESIKKLAETSTIPKTIHRRTITGPLYGGLTVHNRVQVLLNVPKLIVPTLKVIPIRIHGSSNYRHGLLCTPDSYTGDPLAVYLALTITHFRDFWVFSVQEKATQVVLPYMADQCGRLCTLLPEHFPFSFHQLPTCLCWKPYVCTHTGVWPTICISSLRLSFEFFRLIFSSFLLLITSFCKTVW